MLWLLSLQSLRVSVVVVVVEEVAGLQQARPLGIRVLLRIPAAIATVALASVQNDGFHCVDGAERKNKE